MNKPIENNLFDLELGFGRYKNKKISDFTDDECDYLLWALKNVRLPKLLWTTIIKFLDTKLILDTRTCLGSKKKMYKRRAWRNREISQVKPLFVLKL